MSNARVYSLLLSVTTLCMSFAWSGEAALGKTVVKTTSVKKTSGKKSDISIRQDLKEPVVLASKDGVLEVRLTARQGQAKLDTVAKPANNFLLFSYEVIRGTASDRNNSATNLYPAPTLKVYPGEKMIVHFENELKNLTIKDYFIPAYTAEGQPIPLTPPQMKESPINLHIHGAHISPKGNADNVMLDIPPGMTNTYTYDIPKNMPQGLYWYHCHLHGLTSPQTYCGLAGMLAVGKTDGNIPVVTDNKIPVRNLALQYNFIFDRAGGSADLNNAMWPMWLNTLVAPKKGELESGKYRPSQMPVNFNESKKGTKFATIWYEGPLSVRNHRGQFSLIPTNLQSFTPNDKKAGGLPENPSLPDYLRDVQYTVNGQFQPVIKSKAGQTEIWVLANISDLAYMNVQLTETATGKHPKIAIVGQDGNPYSTVHYPRTVDGTRLLIPPATRFAIAVTIPAEGELILEMPALGKTAVNNGQYDLTKTLSSPGVMYTSNGTENPPGVLGRMSIDPKYISYFDGFFIFPTQVLMRAKAVEPGGVTTAFVEGQKIGAYTSYVDLSKATPDVKRKIVMNGGFLNSLADKNDPKAFMYAFDGQTFPNTSLIQPRLNSIEEWNFVNYNNDEHPIHVHVNDFQVTEYHDPTNGARFGPENFSVDNANAPAPKIDLEENVNAPGILSFRTRFDEYTGTYVTHCHRLNHEDNGLMSTINVIPAVSTYAVAIPGAPGRATEIHVYDGEDDRLVASVIPFPFYEGNVNVAMGDVDGDGILDLLVGSGKDHEPEVIAYAGASILGKGIFGTELAHFKPFDSSARNGVTVASAQIDGTQSDNLIVGSPAGITDEVKVYDIPLAGSNNGPTLFASFKPYGDDKSGVSVAAGMVDFVTGREDIVTAPGAGTPTEIKTFAYSLFYPNEKARKGQTNPADTLQNNTSFFPFGKDYTGGVSLTTGWLAGSLGGAKSIIASQLSGSGTVKVFSSGSALDKGPAVYMGQCRCGKDAPFRETSSFNPFTESGAVHVAATSTTTGAHLVVSGSVDGKTKASVLKYDFKRPTPDANMLEPVRLGEVWSGRATSAAALGGF